MCHAYTFFGDVRPLLGREVINKTSMFYNAKEDYVEIKPAP